ncbi:MAG: hypothetical protein K8L91_22035 [Anaerolineae bacterium]|nr:hypothetical protein [Anaerolineae bacterium]
MIDMSRLDHNGITQFGRELLRQRDKQLGSFEEVAQVCCSAFYRAFTDADGNPAFALFRIFRISRYPELTPEMKATVDPADDQWLTLMATIGDEPAWCDRRQSQGHGCIPKAAAMQAPMLTEAFRELNLTWEGTPAGEGFHLARLEEHISSRYFYVRDAVGSHYIPAQADFVVPYDVQSVIGLGSGFMSGAAAFAIGFSRVRVGDEQAAVFAEISPYLLTVLASYEERGTIWS